MPHDCIDWSTHPPARKAPFLVLAHGPGRVYAPVPKDLKTLEETARKEFDLGDVDVHLFSSCASLCDGEPARITESAWEHLHPYIGCATVEIADEAHPPTSSKRKLSEDDDDDRSESGHAGPSTLASDHPPRKQRRVASDTADPEEERSVPVTSPPFPVVSPEEKSVDPPVDDAPTDRPIKQEKIPDRTASHSEPPHPPSQENRETPSQAVPPESGENYKVMLRVAHRPSNQESKFTTKSTTKVNKVLIGACRSFKLDPDRATMYLIVMMEDEENLFPCDRNDSITRAGAERDTESRFLLKIAGED